MAPVDFRQFRYFIAVAEELHFGRAAERLHIAQSGLSQQILKLERSVGVQLLSRDRRGVELTEAGRVFLDRARQAVELADRAMASPHLTERGKTGLLRVGTPILGVPPTEGTIQAFRDRFPDVEVEPYPDVIPRLIDGIVTYALDVALVVSPFKSVDPPPRYEQLGTYELVALVGEGHRLAGLERVPRAELLKEPFLDWPRNINPEMIDHINNLVFAESNHPQAEKVAQPGGSLRFEQVVKGEKVTVVPRPPNIEGFLPAGVVFRQLDEPAPLIDHGIVWARRQVSTFVDAFVEVAREVAASEATPDRNLSNIS